MASTEKIIGKIQDGIKMCSDNYNIKPTDIRLKIMVENGKVKLFLLTDRNLELSINSIFRLSAMESLFVLTEIKKKMFDIAKKKNIDEKAVSAVFFTKDDTCYPSLRLLSSGTIKCELGINDFIN